METADCPGPGRAPTGIGRVGGVDSLSSVQEERHVGPMQRWSMSALGLTAALHGNACTTASSAHCGRIHN
eukprot:1564425-Pyramimonas_sp.AAC.1